jgi:hypothetical protein
MISGIWRTNTSLDEEIVPSVLSLDICIPGVRRRDGQQRGTDCNWETSSRADLKTAGWQLRFSVCQP